MNVGTSHSFNPLALLTMTDLMGHLNPRRHPELKRTCEHNRDRIVEWAKNGYKGQHPKTQFVYEREGEDDLITDEPRGGTDHWNKVKRRTDDPMEESSPNLPSNDYMDRIIKLWDVGTPLLRQIMIDPEEIRKQPGGDLHDINAKINKIKDEYIREVGGPGEDAAKGIPDLSIPTGMVVEMIVECTERLIRNNFQLTNDKEVENALEMIKKYVTRAGQGDLWIKNMEEAFDFHNKKAQELRKQGAEDINKIHESGKLWKADLIEYIRTRYMASAPSRESPAEWRSAEKTSPDPDKMSVDGDAQSAAGESSGAAAPGPSTSPDPASPSAAAHPKTSAPGTSLPSQTSSKSVLAQTIRYKGERRPIGGVRSVGPNRYQFLLQVNDVKAVNPFWHIVASGKLTGDPKEYLEQGGYLVKATESTEPQEKKNSVEGGIMDLKGGRLGTFRMKGIAVIPRQSGEGYQNATTHIVQGYLQAKGPETSKFYTISTLAKAFRKRREAIQEAIEDHMEVNQFALQAKPLERPTKSGRRGKKFREDDTEDEGEDIEHESDGPLDKNDGVYSTKDPFGFVVEDRPSSTTQTSRKQEMETLKADIMGLVDEKLSLASTSTDGKLDELKALIQGLQVTR